MTYFRDKLFEIAHFFTRQVLYLPFPCMSGLPVSKISGSTIAHRYTHMHTHIFLLRKDFNFVAKLKKACQEAVGKKAAPFLQLFLDSVQNSPSMPFTLDTFSLQSQILFFIIIFLNNWQILGCVPPLLVWESKIQRAVTLYSCQY